MNIFLNFSRQFQCVCKIKIYHSRDMDGDLYSWKNIQIMHLPDRFEPQTFRHLSLRPLLKEAFPHNST